MALLSSIESEEWYCGKISRRTAEEYLMGHINARGTFLIRWHRNSYAQYHTNLIGMHLILNSNGAQPLTATFRESEQNPGGFALSIKDWEQVRDQCNDKFWVSGQFFSIYFPQERSYHVKHYKIKPLDGNRGYYITTRQTFTSLQELVKGYQTTLCKVDFYTSVSLCLDIWIISGPLLPANKTLPEASPQGGPQ